MAFKDTLDKRRVTIDQCGELTDKTVFVNQLRFLRLFVRHQSRLARD